MSNPVWNNKALRDHARRLGHREIDPLPVAIDSVSRAIAIFHYHAYQAYDVVRAVVKDGEPATEEHLMLALGASDQQEQYHEASLAGQAHILGALHAARSMYDILSHVVNGLLLTPQLSVDSCDIHKARDALPSGNLRTTLDGLIQSHWFQYIQGFINIAKHRYLISPNLGVCFIDNVAAMKISAFEYKGRQFPQYWTTDVLKGAFEVRNKIIECGCALNAACGLT